ncbi:RCC1 domain-containing protein [Actinomadura logoneensis]|nr:Ig-like domain repeat protein [Actinomadura logoneensis]
MAVLMAVTCVVAEPAARRSAAAAPFPVAPVNSALATGYNFNGQLGDGTTTSRDTPGPVALPEGVSLTNIDAGDYHNLAVTSEGRVLGWGQNAYGELGNGTEPVGVVSIPVYASLPAGVTVTQVSGGYHHSLAVTSDGRVLGWGYNGYGQLGDGSTTTSNVPVEAVLPQGVRVKQVAAGYSSSLALTTDGRVLAWGDNNRGELGDGTTITRHTPVWVHLPADLTITQVAAGDTHGLALTSDSRVWGWGLNQFGELGTNPTWNYSPVQVPMPGGTLKQIAAGDRDSMAVTSDGRVLAWGQNNAGKLGDGTTTHRSTPVEAILPEGVAVTQVDTGVFHSAAVTSDGRALGWGGNFDGQLGDGTTIERHTPVFMLLPDYYAATQITVGRYHTAMLAERASSHTSLTAQPTHAAPGDEVTLTATVTCSAGEPTGTVTFWDGDRQIGTAELNSAGTATLRTTELDEGQHHITARYEGSDICPPSDSEPVTVTISAEPSRASLHLAKEFAGFVTHSKGKHKAKHWHAARLSAWHDHDVIKYRFIVTNDGDVPLHAITVHDSRTGTVSCTTDTLQPGRSATCYATHKITWKEKSQGYVDNTATATGTREDGETVTSNKAHLRVDITYK